MLDPDTRQEMERQALARRAKGQPVIDEMKAIVAEHEEEIRALKRQVNVVSERYGIPRPYPEIQ